MRPKITSAQVRLVQAKLTESEKEEGFAIKLFIQIGNQWRALVELASGEKILSGTT